MYPSELILHGAVKLKEKKQEKREKWIKNLCPKPVFSLLSLEDSSEKPLLLQTALS